MPNIRSLPLAGSVLAVPVAALLLASCGGPSVDTKAHYDAYDREYRAANKFTEHRVPRGSHNLYVREFGAKTLPSRPPILLMHGFPDSLHLYDRVAPLLGKSRRVIAFDFLGWGRSDKPAGHRYDVASLRTDLEAVIRHFDLSSVILVVHDASGQPAIDWALDNPNRVAGLALLNTYYGPMPTLKPPEAIATFSTPGIWRDVQVFGAMRSDSRWQSGVMAQLSKFVSNADVRRTYIPVFAHQALGIRPAFFGLNEVLRAEVDRRAGEGNRLRAFTPPVRIIFGADDPYLNTGVARAFKGVFPKADLFLLDGASHYVQLDRPQRVAQLILDAPFRVR